MITSALIESCVVLLNVSGIDERLLYRATVVVRTTAHRNGLLGLGYLDKFPGDSLGVTIRMYLQNIGCRNIVTRCGINASDSIPFTTRDMI